MAKDMNHIWTTGTRKTSTARVHMLPGSGKILINNKSIDDYFGNHPRHKTAVLKPMHITELLTKYDTYAYVKGGGITGQADALKLGIARGLATTDEKIRIILRKNGLLTRDSRMVERKKAGQPKARKRFQYSKR